MFLLGHSCWSYLLSKSTGQDLRVNLPAYLALLSGVLPDFDIYFRPYVIHHTWTHSLVFLGPIVIILSIRFGRLGLAFSVGLLSHLLTDYFVGTVPLFFPFYQNFLPGLKLGIPSLADTVLEVGALGAVVLYAWLNGDSRLISRPSRDSLLLAVPLLAIVTLTLLYAVDYTTPLTEIAFSRRALTLISIGHIVLIGLLSLVVLRTLVPWLKSRITRITGSKSTTGSP